MKVLLTGGAGFIGSHIADALIENGYEVVIIDDLSSGKKENLNPKAKFYQLDICDPKISEIFKKEKPDIVNHHAAQISVRRSIENPIIDAKINILGLLNLLNNCRQYKIKKIIFPSSGGTIYGETEEIPSAETTRLNPLSPYAIAKVTGEYYLNFYWQVHKIPYVVMRYGNVYGPRQDSKGEAGVVAIFAEKMLKNEQPIINGNGLQTRDYVYISDIVEANLKAIKRKETGIYNIGTSIETNVIDIFFGVKKATKAKVAKKHGSAIEGELLRTALSYKKAKKELDWEAKISLRIGLQKVISWYRDNH